MTNSIADEVCVHVPPYFQQVDGDEVIIGHPERAVFIAIPGQAAEVLDWLAKGLSPADTSALFRSRNGEDLDLEGFLEILEAKGFVQRTLGAPASEDGTLASRVPVVPAKPPHFTWIPEKAARALFAPAAIWIYLGIIASGVSIAATHPYLIPSWRSLAFQNHFLTVALITLFLNLLAAFFHEMGHLLAARRRSISARLGVGNRLWMVVAETDVTGLWVLPPKQRYLPFLAGILVDAVSASVLILFLFLLNVGVFGHLIPLVQRVTSAMLFGYFLRLVWQCYFFLRTDLYYVFANFFHCKDLLGDTVTFLKNRLPRILPSIQYADQSHIPRREMGFIRIYAVVWVLGRLLAAYVLVIAQIPLLFYYTKAIFRHLVAGPGANLAAYSESVTISSISLTLAVLGFGLWFRSLARRGKEKHEG